MDTERNLLFGVLAFQHGAVAADGLAETCADWAAHPTEPLAELMVDRGLLTQEQKTELEQTVAAELAAHGEDPRTTLAATLDGRSLEAIAPVTHSDTGLREAIAALAPTDASFVRDPAGATLAPTDAGFDLGLAVAARPAAAPQGGHVVLGSLAPAEAEARDRYTLTHLHARGGMGRVWLARDGALGRRIALKELRPDQADNPVVCSRFLYEARITAQLEHPGIVPVYELGSEGAPYYTMRFVRGKTLSEAIRAYHKKRAAGAADSVGLVELLTAFVGVCHAVAYAHARGVIHRDLKGQNVVLGDYGEVIVLDWGLAKRVGPDPVHGESPAGVIGSAPPAAEAATVVAGDDANARTVLAGAKSAPGPASSPGSGHASRSNGSASHGHGSATGSGSGSPVKRESGAGPEGTLHGQLLGTPAYMAPEQAKGHHDRVDHRTDIYGLGAILYEVLTGRPPFLAPKSSEVIRKVCQEPPTPPRQIVATIAPGLEAICLKALSKEPSQRYATASELAQEVQRWLADEPVQAFPEPWTQRAARWARRHRTAAATAASLMVVTILALGIGSILIARERDEAEAQGQQARQAVHLLTKGADIAFDDQLDPVQKEMLEDALAYYEKFTGRSSGDPAVRLEHGRAYQQMGDIQRKLGRLAEAEHSYRRSVELLAPLAAGVNREASQALARTRTLLGDLLVRRGADKSQVEDLYRQALEAQRELAAGAHDPAATAEAQLRLGQTLKSQADLMRLNGQFRPARPAYDQAIAELERAHAADARRGEIRNELALAVDARGWIHRELGEIPRAESDFRRALELLEGLVGEFPTVSRHREALARALNSLGLLEESTGRLADAEGHLRRERELVERLAQDFPDRPEHRRELARTLSNLGSVLLHQDRLGDAEPILRRAVAVNDEIAAKHPDDVQIRFDLAKDHNNLGELLRTKADPKSAAASFVKAREILEKLVQDFPEQPRYRDVLANNLVNLGVAFWATDPARAEELFNTALGLFDKLVADHPDNVEYRLGQARCLLGQGAALTTAKRSQRAEDVYRRALAQLQPRAAQSRTPEAMRLEAEVLNNLGDLLRDAGRPEAEPTLRQALNLLETLAARPTASPKDRHSLAAASYNLGETLLGLKRRPEAAPCFARAVTGLEKLAADAPRSVDYHSQLGMALAQQGALLAEAGQLHEARTALASAVDHQARAVQLSRNRDDTRAWLGNHLLDLAGVNLKLGADREAAESALKAPQAVPEASRGQAYLHAARILARLVIRAGADPKLAQADRDHLARNYLGRTIVLLREVIDADPQLAGSIQNDPDIKALEARPEFQAMMNALVILRP